MTMFSVGLFFLKKINMYNIFTVIIKVLGYDMEI